MILLQNVLKMSSRRICETSWRRFEDVLKTSWQDVLKMSWRRFCKTSWRRLENVLKTSWRRIAKTNILVLTKTSWRRLEDVFWRRMINKNIFVFIKTSWRRLEDVFWRRRRNTSLRRLQDECLLGYLLDFESIFCKIYTKVGITFPRLLFYLEVFIASSISWIVSHSAMRLTWHKTSFLICESPLSFLFINLSHDCSR